MATQMTAQGAAPGFNIGRDQLRTFGTVIGSMINNADEKYREELKDLEGTEIEIAFSEMGSLVIRIKGDKILTFVRKSKKPKTLIQINKQPHELIDVYLPMILDPMKDSLGPILKQGLSLFGIIRLLPKLKTALKVIIGGMLNKNLVIKGSIVPLLPIVEVALVGFLSGQDVDPGFADQRERERQEFLKNLNR